MAKFRIKTSAPKGHNTWGFDLTAKVQEGLFAAVAMIVAASAEAEQKLMAAIAAAKVAKMSA